MPSDLIYREDAKDFVRHAYHKGLNPIEYLDEVPAAYALQSAPKWISVKERLPEKGISVLCACRANILCVMKWAGIDWFENPTHVYMSGFVTHWMPLPEPPKEEEEEEE